MNTRSIKANGISFKEFFNPVNRKIFSDKYGVYLISVQIPEYHEYVKIGCGNLYTRILDYKTILNPISEYCKIHILAVKKHNRIPKEYLVGAKKHKSYEYYAEDHIKAELKRRNIKHQGEWYCISIPKLAVIFETLHFSGLPQYGVKGDGGNGGFYVFNDDKKERIEKKITNQSEDAPIRRSDRNKKTKSPSPVLVLRRSNRNK